MTEAAQDPNDAAENEHAADSINTLRELALQKIVELAHEHSSIASAARAVNALLQIDYSDGAWRGLMVRNPQIREQVRERLQPTTHHVEVEGSIVGEQLPDPLAVLERSIERFNRLRDSMNRQRNQTIRFPNRPIAIAFAADNHIGNDGVDYERMFSEAELIADTENMYAINLGDLADNFIVQKLLSLRMFTSTTIPEEWALVQHYVRILGPSLLAVIGGNHDGWTKAIAGVDQLQNILAYLRPDLLYHSDELLVNIQVGPLSVPARLRHKWRYNSVLNPTHGIERTYERDQAKRFLLGVGAHTHISGLSRQFNAGGQTGLAVICGAYKIYDPFAVRLGLAEANKSTAVTVIFHPQYGMTGYDNLELAAEKMNQYNADYKE